MIPLAAFLLSHGARTIPSSRLAKEVIHLGNRPVCFTTWYKFSSSCSLVRFWYSSPQAKLISAYGTDNDPFHRCAYYTVRSLKETPPLFRLKT